MAIYNLGYIKFGLKDHDFSRACYISNVQKNPKVGGRGALDKFKLLVATYLAANNQPPANPK